MVIHGISGYVQDKLSGLAIDISPYTKLANWSSTIGFGHSSFTCCTMV